MWASSTFPTVDDSLTCSNQIFTRTMRWSVDCSLKVWQPAYSIPVSMSISPVEHIISLMVTSRNGQLPLLSFFLSATVNIISIPYTWKRKKNLPSLLSSGSILFCIHQSWHLTHTVSVSLSQVWVRSSHGSFSVKEVFLEISQNPPKNTCARVSFWIKL